jgi:hypothetical protein
MTMKKRNEDIKKIIKRKMEARYKNLVFIQRRDLRRNGQFIINKSASKSINNEKMNDRDRLRIFGAPVNVPKISYTEKTLPSNKNLSYPKRVYVDYDVVICIPSYDRYEKVRRLISQFYSQPTKYTFKIILLNDGSSDLAYDTLNKEFPEIVYLKNKTPNGKMRHWHCYSQLWENLKGLEFHTTLQMDDDFILSDGFLNTIVDFFYYLKDGNENIKAVAPHLWSTNKNCNTEPWWTQYNTFVDGIALIERAVLEFMSYQMTPVDPVKVSVDGSSALAWAQVGSAIKKMNGIVYRTANSLVYHDGNNDSKLHPNHRNMEGGKVYTQKYIGKL